MLFLINDGGYLLIIIPPIVDINIILQRFPLTEPQRNGMASLFFKVIQR